METENSLWFFRGKDARRAGEPLESGYRLRGKNWAAWRKGWEAQGEELKCQARTPEQIAEAEDAAQWLDIEIEKWKAEI